MPLTPRLDFLGQRAEAINWMLLADAPRALAEPDDLPTQTGDSLTAPPMRRIRGIITYVVSLLRGLVGRSGRA
jgi:hypothetical protein